MHRDEELRQIRMELRLRQLLLKLVLDYVWLFLIKLKLKYVLEVFQVLGYIKLEEELLLHQLRIMQVQLCALIIFLL